MADTERIVQQLKKQLLYEFAKGDRSGIYAVTSRELAYNSNRIEGSTLTEDQTAALFDTGALPPSDDVYRAKDIEEMNGHFLMFNHMLKTLEEPLSETLIKAFHYDLKSGVFEDRANGYEIGAYKTRPNIAGTMHTSLPKDVPSDMRDLLEWYGTQEITLGVLAAFHARYEHIHPFQDGNGRTGRLLLYRESLRAGIMPPIIEDRNRIEYISGIRAFTDHGDAGRLCRLLKTEQDVYAQTVRFFLEGE